MLNVFFIKRIIRKYVYFMQAEMSNKIKIEEKQVKEINPISYVKPLSVTCLPSFIYVINYKGMLLLGLCLPSI